MDKSDFIFMRRILIMLMILSGYSILNSLSVHATTITVCGSGCDYSSIQTAIDNANNGDVIEVQSGNYQEQVIVNKEITLTGVGDPIPVIDVSGLNFGISIEASNVIVEGFEIVGDSATTNGIVVNPGSDNVIVRNNVVHGMGNPYPEFLAHGILIWGNNNWNGQDLTLTASSWDDACNPTYADPPQGTQIVNNEVYDVLGSGISLGDCTEDTLIKNNYVHDINPVTVNDEFISIGLQGRTAKNVNNDGNIFENLIVGVNLGKFSNGLIENDNFNNVNLKVAHIKGEMITVANIGEYAKTDFIEPFQGEEVTGYFTSIQNAVDLAEENGVVYVAPGTYNENIAVNKPLTLYGIQSSKPVIDGDVNGDGTPDGSCITINADGVIIDGFEIKNCYNGITGETSNSVIRNNIIHDNLNVPGSAGVGILLWGDNDNNQILNNEIYNNDRQGIFVGHCDFAGPNGDCAAGGTKISSGNVIRGNVIHDNGRYTYDKGPDPSQYGVQLWNAVNNIIENNEIYNHNTWIIGGTTPFGMGIYLCASGGNAIRNNNLHDNFFGVGIWGKDCGPSPTSGGNNMITGNIIMNNFRGIQVFGVSSEVGYASTQQVHFNNIYDNILSVTGLDNFGVKNSDTGILNAKNNWWGCSNGPGNTGCDDVSNNIDFDPWLRSAISENSYVREMLDNGESITSTDGQVTLTSYGGSGTAEIVKYEGNPGVGSAVFSSDSKFYDVRFINTNANKVEIKFCNAGGSKIYWFDKNANVWRLVSNQQIQEDGCILATINSGTMPNLDQLSQDPPFGGGTPVMVPVMNSYALIVLFTLLMGIGFWKINSGL